MVLRFRYLLLLAGGAVLVAAGPSPADAIKARQERMKSIGKSFKAVSDQVRSGSPDAAVVRANAQELARLGANVAPLFRGPLTAPGVKSAAKPEVRTRWPEFSKSADDLSRSTQALATLAARTSDPAALGPALRTIGGACKGCHDTFKIKDE